MADHAESALPQGQPQKQPVPTTSEVAGRADTLPVEEPLKASTNSTETAQVEVSDVDEEPDEAGRTETVPVPEEAPLKTSTDSTEHVTINIGEVLHAHVASTSDVPSLDDRNTAESVTRSEE